MSNDTKIQKYDETLQSSAANLRLYAEGLDDVDLGLKLQSLAEQTVPQIKGINAPQRVAIPQIFLRQNSSNSSMIPENTKPGQLFTSQGDAIGDSLSFIPIYTHNIRKKWGEEKIECQSMDGVNGSRHGACKECPYGRFEPNTRPECSSGTCYYVVTEDLARIYKIEFIKTSAKAGRAIRQLSLPPAMWSRAFTLSAKKVSGNNRNYFELAVTATNRRTPEDISKACDILYEYFNSNYEKTLLLQAEYAKAGKTTVVNTEGVPAEAEEEINFRDSV